MHDRIMRMDFRIRGHDPTITAVYTLTDNADSSIKNEFENALTFTINCFRQRKEILDDLSTRSGGK